MNSALEKMLREFSSTHFYGTVEITYTNGVPNVVRVNRTYKLSTEVARSNRENRGDNHGQPVESR